MLSDLGSNFISEVIKETCNIFGIERIYTSPYHPQTDGLLEKFHSTLGKNLSMCVARDHKDWDLYVRGTFEPLENLNEAAKEFVRTNKISIEGKKNKGSSS